MLTDPNAATPLCAVAAPPLSVAPDVPVPAVIVRASAGLADVTKFPSESRTATWIAGAIAVPAATLVGCTLNVSRVAGAGLTVNDGLVDDARVPSVARSL